LLEALAGTLTRERRHLSADGREVRPFRMENYLDRVRYCPQHPSFLEGPFQHSVLFGKEIAPLTEVASEALELRDIMENRSIAEGANNISGGEAKRLSLLRLINRPGNFNLFDEPTASLDKATGDKVWELIFSSFNRKGLICATHDLTALPRFDRVIVIKQGRVIADGHWSELENEETVTEAVKEIANGDRIP
jgi:ATP-binding cassette subfamily B protein/ATP-binding cassette subfamily B protein RtxE